MLDTECLPECDIPGTSSSPAVSIIILFIAIDAAVAESMP
jgi:hypothetical protein